MRLSPRLLYYQLPWSAGILLILICLLPPAERSVAHAVAAPPLAPERILIPAELKLILPYFPGCEDSPSAEKRSCSTERLYEYIYANTGYPAGKPYHKTAGVVAISFLVKTDGTVADPLIINAPDNERGYDARRVVMDMNKAGIRWKPATHNGTPVNCRMQIQFQYNMAWGMALPSE